MSRQPADHGLTLQRGGEELLLDKLPDRFTTRLSQPEALATVRDRLSFQALRSVARGQLVEWTVAPEQLEAQLLTARALPEVRFASHAYRLVESPQTGVYLTDQITLQFVPDYRRQDIVAILQQHGLRQLRPLTGIPNTWVCTVTAAADENPIKLANRLMALPAVLTAEPNVVIETEALYRPRDSLYAQQWHLAAQAASDISASADISVESAWDVTRGARSVVIAVSDDGFDLDHPDLQGMGKLVAPQDLRANDAVPLPMKSADNHGTACAGLAIAEENQTGVVGVAPGCGFMPIRTTGFLDDESIEAIFNWAQDHGAAVISCSWAPAAVYFPLSLRQRHALTQAAIQGRNGKGCVIVFAAGNANRPVSGTVHETDWPQNALKGDTRWLNGFAVHPDVITVSACTSLNRKAVYSNWGEHVAIAAPSNNAVPSMALPELGSVATGPVVKQRLLGRGMVTSDRGGTAGYDRGAYTRTFGGTSSACPVVAGVAGLMLSVNPDLSAREVKQILQATADKIVDQTPDPQLGRRYGTYDQNGHSRWFGYGRVNAHRAVLEARRRAGSQRQSQRSVTLTDAADITIPDGQPTGLVRTVQSRDQVPVEDLQVFVSLEHACLSDLTLTLRSPSGGTVLLQGRTLGGTSKLAATYSLKSTPALRRLIGETAAGSWQLQVVDHAPGHRGQLLTWRLILALGNGGSARHGD